jgi:peptide/nickel transport system substrate-binding protein
MRTKRGARAAVLLLGASLVAAACGSSKSETSTTTAGGGATTAAGAATTAAGAATTAAGAATTAAGTTAAPTTVAAAKGGTVTIGAEQEPDCADWIGSCGGSSWGYWMMNITTMPRAFDVVKSGNDWVPKASAVLAEEPKLETVGGKPTVTYKISPKAVWSTGDPITSADFKYTWDQIKNGKDIYDTTGYADVEAVDDSKPDTAVVTFSKSFAPWKQLFSAGYGILPSKVLTGKDRNAEMKDGYTWSAGPWKIEKWEKGVSITLIPNDKFFGTKPNLDKIVFKFVTDTAAEFQAFKAGEVDLIYPQPQIAVVDAIQAGLPADVKSAVNAQTGNAEALWINMAKAPFDVLEVRQAFAYSLDRDAIVNRLFGPLGVKTALQSLNPALVSKYAGTDFSVYKKDLKKVEELMTKAGYAKGSDGIWAKGGVKASFKVRTTAGNARRELTQQVMIQQMKEAGFEMTADNLKAGDLFGKAGPAGDFQVGLWAQVATFPDPSLCQIMCSKNIPDDAGKGGSNWTRTKITALDPLLEQVDSELDDAKRVTAAKSADKIMSDNMVSLPLDPLPNILLWNTKKVSGNVSDNPVAGPFATSHEWAIAK